MPDFNQPKRGRPAKPGKTAFNFRMSGELRKLLRRKRGEIRACR